MLTANEQKRTIAETADLGIGMLIAETEGGTYQPVAAVATISEAREMASHDFRRRMKELDRGGEPVCPARYTVWARNVDGDYRNVHEIEAA